MNERNSMARRIRIGTLVGAGVGAVIAGPAILGAIMSGGAGHGSYVAARLLFPFSMLLARLEGSGLSLCAWGCSSFRSTGHWSALRTYQALSMLTAAHLLAALACFAGLLPDFS
jgi:hypothetical protein